MRYLWIYPFLSSVSCKMHGFSTQLFGIENTCLKLFSIIITFLIYAINDNPIQMKRITFLESQQIPIVAKWSGRKAL